MSTQDRAEGSTRSNGTKRGWRDTMDRGEERNPQHKRPNRANDEQRSAKGERSSHRNGENQRSEWRFGGKRDRGRERGAASSDKSDRSLFSRISGTSHRQNIPERTKPGQEDTPMTIDKAPDADEQEEQEAHQRRIRRLKRRRRSAGLESDVSDDELIRWSDQVEASEKTVSPVKSTDYSHAGRSSYRDRQLAPTEEPKRVHDDRGAERSRWRRNDDNERSRQDQRDDERQKRREDRREVDKDVDERLKKREERLRDQDGKRDRRDRYDTDRNRDRNVRADRDRRNRLDESEARSSGHRSPLPSHRSPREDGSRRVDRSPEAVLLRRRRQSRSLSPLRDETVHGKDGSTISREAHGNDDKDRTLFQPAPSSSLPARAQADEVYERIAQVGEGTYGQVFKAKSDRTGILVALKRIRMKSEREGFPITAMREVKLLQRLRHENVVRLHEMMLSKQSIYMVFEYLQHDLNGVLAQPSIVFSPAHLKSLAEQLLAGLAYLHRHSILHRDLKCSNLLLNNEGTLKLADFGLARSYTKQSRAPRKRTLDYTNRVVTLWYRAPELLFGETSYGDAIDVWGAGCIFLELFARKPVFQGNDEIHQVQVLFDLLGPVRKEDWPEAEQLPWFDLVQNASVTMANTGEPANSDARAQKTTRERIQQLLGDSISDDAIDVAVALLTYNPDRRLSAQEALDSLPYFSQNLPTSQKPKELLEAVEGEWHEFESRRAKRDAAAQALHAHVNREREQQKDRKRSEREPDVSQQDRQVESTDGRQTVSAKSVDPIQRTATTAMSVDEAPNAPIENRDDADASA